MAPRGKLVDRWIYKYKGIDAPDRDADDDGIAPSRRGPVVREKVAEVELRLIKESVETDEAPYPLKSVAFEVSCREPSFAFRGTDAEALRKAAWGELDAAFKIKWEQWLLINSEHVRPHGGDMGTGLLFRYESIERGTAHDGTSLMRRLNLYRPGEPWEIKPWPGEFRDSKGNVMACVPATEEYKLALEQFTTGVDGLRMRIADYLRPHNIEHTLSNLASVRLGLLGPKES